MTDNWNADGPVIVWENYGYDGWKPRSFPTLTKALLTGGITEGMVITRLIDVERLLATAGLGPESTTPPVDA